MKYHVIHSDCIFDFVQDVNDALEQGWEPIGGIAVAINDFASEDCQGYSKDNFKRIWAQALIKRDPHEKETQQTRPAQTAQAD